MKKTFVKVVAFAATAALALGLLAGCASGGSSSSAASSSASSSAQAQADTSADIEALIVGFDNSYPPYGYIGADGEYTGFDLDLAAEVAARNNWDLQLEAIDWDAKDALLGQGTVNCIWNGFTMEGREDGYTFSEPYMLNQQVIVTKADSGINSEADLAGKAVITQIDSAALEVLEGDKQDLTSTFRLLDTISDYNNAFMQLEAGTVDAVACDLSIAAYQMAAKPGVYVQLPEPLSSEHYAVGFAKGSDALAQVVSDTLKQMYQDGTIETLCQKYADQGLDFNNWILK